MPIFVRARGLYFIDLISHFKMIAGSYGNCMTRRNESYLLRDSVPKSGVARALYSVEHPCHGCSTEYKGHLHLNIRMARMITNGHLVISATVITTIWLILDSRSLKF